MSHATLSSTIDFLQSYKEFNNFDENLDTLMTDDDAYYVAA